jgi:hypothetical protein
LFLCYECAISPEALSKLAQKEGWKLTEKENVVVIRDMLGLPKLRKIEGVEVDWVPEALFYEDRKANNGGVTVAYDLE